MNLQPVFVVYVEMWHDPHHGVPVWCNSSYTNDLVIYVSLAMFPCSLLTWLKNVVQSSVFLLCLGGCGLQRLRNHVSRQ